MALAVENLIHQAETGVKLTTADRRRCVGYLMTTELGISNTEMAAKFGVTEKTIRDDKKIVKTTLVDEMKEEDAGAVAADLAFNFRRQLRDLAISKNACRPGSTEYRRHCTDILEIELKKMRAFQDLGLLPKNLGNMTVDSFEYAAVVLRGDSIDARAVHAFDEKTQDQIRARQQKALESGEAVDAEFTDIPQGERTVEYAEVGKKEHEGQCQDPI